MGMQSSVTEVMGMLHSLEVCILELLLSLLVFKSLVSIN